MQDIKRILIPIDFSETSLAALEFGADLAVRLGATISLLHVVEPIPFDAQNPAADTSLQEAEALGQAGQELDRLARRLRGALVTLSLVRTGLAWEEISTVARDFVEDLIVMGTHGRSGLAKVLLGSVTENVIRTSEKPVVVVHARGGPHLT